MKIEFPKKNECLKADDKNEGVLQFLARRRSGLVRAMGQPGPTTEQRDLILKLAARVPDHRKLFPWRFILFEGKARERFGERLAKKFIKDNPDAPESRVTHERERFLRAPLVVGVISSPKDCPRGTPIWEQELSAGAVCQNMLLAARASGFAAQWLSEWYAFDPEINEDIGLKDHERVAGYIYMGTATEHPMERPRPELNTLITYWSD